MHAQAGGMPCSHKRSAPAKAGGCCTGRLLLRHAVWPCGTPTPGCRRRRRASTQHLMGKGPSRSCSQKQAMPCTRPTQTWPRQLRRGEGVAGKKAGVSQPHRPAVTPPHFQQAR